jgi:hypothetical protein
MRALLSAVLALCLLALPLAPPAAASSEALAFDAVLLVREAELGDLLAAGVLGDYALLLGGEQFAEHALLTPADLGLDPEALLGGRLSDDALLTPAALGLGGPSRHFLFGFSPFFPFFRGFGTLSGTLTFMFRGATITQTFTNVRVPVFRFFPFFGLLPFHFGRVLVVRVG